MFESWRTYLINKFYKNIGRGWRILEIGTGFLSNLEILLEHAAFKAKIVTLDPNEKFLENAKNIFDKYVKEGFLFTLKGVAEKLPFYDETFDMVVSTMTFHHLENISAGVREAWRVTKPRGYLIILDWDEGGAMYSPHSPEELLSSKNSVVNEFRKLAGSEFSLENHGEWYIVWAVKK